jgi:hypothetical protein
MLLHIVAAYSLLSSALRARLLDSDVYDTTGDNTWIAHLVRARFRCADPFTPPPISAPKSTCQITDPTKADRVSADT